MRLRGGASIALSRGRPAGTSAAGDRDARLARLGVLAAKVDGYDLRPADPAR
jgi:hypothetical protein